jgi:hypothetical protein
MDETTLLTAAQVETLIRGQPISDRDPWATGDEPLVDAFLRTVCDAICRLTGSESKVAWDHYGSGYASFVDAWFYKDTADFDPRQPVQHGHGYTGLVVLLSRLSPHVVFMEGERHWHGQGSSSYLPAFAAIDQFESPGVIALAQQVQPILERHGLVRLTRDALATPLPPDLAVPTILSDEPFTQFDAMFHWED